MNIDSRLKDLGDRLERSVNAELRAAPRAPAHRRRPPVVAMTTAGIAAAGVAAVVFLGAGAGSPTGGGAKLAPSSGSAAVKDTAYIVRRLKANIAAGAEQGTVAENYEYASGEVESDGSLTNLSAPAGLQWFYKAPDTAAFWSDLATNATIARAGETGNVVNGKYYSFALTVNHANQTYSLTQGEKSDPYANDGDNTGAGLVNTDSSSSQVLQALHSGQATQRGTTTVNGTPAIALSVTEPGGDSSEQFWLYVDAQSDQPLRMINDVVNTDGGVYRTGLYVSDWYPASAANVAKAKDRSIPAGYTRVGDAQSSGSGNTGAG